MCEARGWGWTWAKALYRPILWLLGLHWSMCKQFYVFILYSRSCILISSVGAVSYLFLFVQGLLLKVELYEGSFSVSCFSLTIESCNGNQLNGTFCQELVRYDLPLVVCIQFYLFLPTCGARLEVVFGIWMKSNLFQFIENKTHFSNSWYAKMSLFLNGLE